MEKFGHTERKPWLLPLSAGLFLLVLLLFCAAVTDLRQDTRQRQKQQLETALHRSIVSCYALEGRYPESLAYLREHYPLQYNEELFYVDYRVQAGNLMPDVTVLERGE